MAHGLAPAALRLPAGFAMRELWERRGFPVVEGAGLVWSRSLGRVFVPLAPEATLPGSRATLDADLRKAGMFLARIPVANGSGSGAYVATLKGYGLGRVHKGQKRNVERGLERCVIRRIDALELHRLGMAANLDTLQRQGRMDPEFGELPGWSRFCAALGASPTARIHASFVEDQLQSYVVSLREGIWLRALWKHSRTTGREHYADHALDHTLLVEAAAEPGLEFVVNGQLATLGDPGLHRYKLHMGYDEQVCGRALYVAGPLAPALQWPIWAQTAASLRAWFPENRHLALTERALLECRVESSAGPAA